MPHHAVRNCPRVVHPPMECMWVCALACFPPCCSNFMLAFQTAAADTMAHYTMDGFDASVMEIEQDDILRFTDHLQHKLNG
jgi:hypothetical protein